MPHKDDKKKPYRSKPGHKRPTAKPTAKRRRRTK